MGNEKISNTQFAQGSICKVYVRFSNEEGGLREQTSSYIRKQNLWAITEKCKTGIRIK